MEQSMSDAITHRGKRASSAGQVAARRPVLIFVGLLIAIVLTSYGIRIIALSLHVLAGEWWIRKTPPMAG
jgi:hypothetical protein